MNELTGRSAESRRSVSAPSSQNGVDNAKVSTKNLGGDPALVATTTSAGSADGRTRVDHRLDAIAEGRVGGLPAELALGPSRAHRPGCSRLGGGGAARDVRGNDRGGGIGSGIVGGGQRPLTPTEVDEALAAAQATTAVPPALPARTEPPPDASTGIVASPRGTIVARCGAGTVEIVSASPGQGYQLDDEQEGARVRFESDETRVEVHVSCRGGRPVGQVEIED